MEIKNDLILRVARGQEVERTPVWMMRQAGRSLTEYLEVRKKAGSFRNMIADPEIAAEVTVQPVDLIGVDAAIIFSDILVVPEAMGLSYEIVKGKGPVFSETVRNSEELKKLHPVEEESNLDLTCEAIKITKKELYGRVPLIGFAGAPWTLFCYMTEGGGSKNFGHPRGLVYKDPKFTSRLIDMLTDATINYLNRQIDAGADIVQIFDSWAGLLSPDIYQKIALPSIRRICEEVQGVPKIVFAKGAVGSVAAICDLDCQVVGLDWTMNPSDVYRMTKDKALQGNLDPAALYAPPEKIPELTARMMEKFRKGRHIANLGHGIYPDLPRESIEAFVEAVKNYRY